MVTWWDLPAMAQTTFFFKAKNKNNSDEGWVCVLQGLLLAVATPDTGPGGLWG